jgi:hypothetical protein
LLFPFSGVAGHISIFLLIYASCFVYLQFYDISSKATELGICPFTGKWEEIRSNTRWLPRTYALFVILSHSFNKTPTPRKTKF